MFVGCGFFGGVRCQMCVDVFVYAYFEAQNLYVLWVLVFWRCKTSNVCRCSIVDTYFESQELYFFGFWSLEGVGSQMCPDFEPLRHVLKPKNFIFVGFGLSQV
jgi:hypothetical protein